MALQPSPTGYEPSYRTQGQQGHQNIVSMRRTKAGRYASDVTYDELVACFDLPKETAAERLGVGVTILKRICRRMGIIRWPYRRRRSLSVEDDNSETSKGGAPRHWSPPARREAAARAPACVPPPTGPFSGGGGGFRPVCAPDRASSLATSLDWSLAHRSTDTTASESEAPAAAPPPALATAPSAGLDLLAEAIDRVAPAPARPAPALEAQLLQAVGARPDLGRALAALMRDHCAAAGIPVATAPLSLIVPPAPARPAGLSAKLAAVQAEIAARRRDLELMESYVASRYLELAQPPQRRSNPP